MQSLRTATVPGASAQACAQDLLAALHLLMRFVRAEMRRNRRAELTVPQFRALVFVSHTDNPSLSEMAEHLGLSLPAASRMVGLLVKRGLIGRQVRPDNRRSVSLSLTPQGRSTFRKALQATQRAMAQQFETLSGKELAQVSGAVQVLSRVFAA
jgi:DNA-binding MarR family transcriptional regulator